MNQNLIFGVHLSLSDFLVEVSKLTKTSKKDDSFDNAISLKKRYS